MLHSYTNFIHKKQNIVMQQEQESIIMQRFQVIAGRGIIILGLFGILFSFIPLLISYTLGIQQNISEFATVYAEEQRYPKNRSILNPLEARFWRIFFANSYYDPGPEFFKQLEQNYNTQRKVTNATIDTTYSKLMYINIPSLQIKHLKLYPNISGNDKKTYERVLRQGVAHLKHTPLPGDGSNSIIYGHSGLPRILGKYPDWLSFSKLERIKLRDTITITRDGRVLKYKVTSKKIITVDKIPTFVQPTKKEQITLITCWPIGIGSRRLIVIAQRYE